MRINRLLKTFIWGFKLMLEKKMETKGSKNEWQKRRTWRGIQTKIWKAFLSGKSLRNVLTWIWKSISNINWFHTSLLKSPRHSNLCIRLRFRFHLKNENTMRLPVLLIKNSYWYKGKKLSPPDCISSRTKILI